MLTVSLYQSNLLSLTCLVSCLSSLVSSCLRLRLMPVMVKPSPYTLIENVDIAKLRLTIIYPFHGRNSSDASLQQSDMFFL